MYYIIYKTINLINGKYYIGKHQTDDLHDKYLGSGVALQDAIKLHGKENFSRQILSVFSNPDDMNNAEKELITEAVIKDPMSYNIGLGGIGGPHFAGRAHTLETKQVISEKRNEQIITEETKKKISENHWSRRDPEAFKVHASNIGKSIKTEEHKQKIRSTLLGRKKTSTSPLLGVSKKKINCPYCNKIGAAHVMYRYHFDKCKHKS